MRTLLAGLALVTTGCVDWEGIGDTQRHKESFHMSHPLKSGGRLSVETMNGSIEVMSWEKDFVDISGVKYGATEELVQSIRIDVVATADAIRIRTVPPSGARRGYGANYVLRVPRRVELDRLETSNASVRVDSIIGSARLRSSNGSIKVYRLEGSAEATTSNSSIEVNEVSGGALLRTSNGSIRAERVRGPFDATTSNSSIDVRLTDPEPQRPIKLESSNGSITLAVDKLNGNDIRAGTSNSSITLRLPSNVGADLRAHTSNSRVTSDLDIQVRSGKLGKSKVEGTLGSGGPIIDLRSSNGSIRIERL